MCMYVRRNDLWVRQNDPPCAEMTRGCAEMRPLKDGATMLLLGDPVHFLLHLEQRLLDPVDDRSYVEGLLAEARLGSERPCACRNESPFGEVVHPSPDT